MNIPLLVNLIDTNISHACSYDDALESGRSSNKITYVKDQKTFNGITIFTDERLRSVETVHSQFKVAWLMEPRAYAPISYQILETLIDKFDAVLTHDSQLLSRYPNISKRIPADGIFLDSESIFNKSNKNKFCSLLYSNKTMLEGHQLRHSIAKMINDTGRKIDILGSGTGTRLNKKSDALNEYYFSIVVENSIDDFYITEKIFDCFATQTIPIYWGTDQVLKEFNSDAIISFRTLYDLEKILDTINTDFYNENIKAVDENYRSVMKHYSVDDHIADALFHLLKDKE